MFICEKCLTQNYQATVPPFYLLSMSQGNCEVCLTYKLCADVHHSRLVVKVHVQNDTDHEKFHQVPDSDSSHHPKH